MRDLQAFFRTVPRIEFHGVVHRICTYPYRDSVCSMRGSWLHGARYNLKNHFGALYTSLELTTAQAEAGRYFTVPPDCGFVAAALTLQLSRVVDLTDIRLLRRVRIPRSRLIADDHAVCQEFGWRAWEGGVEALLVPSAAVPKAKNLVIFLDRQRPCWGIKLSAVNNA